MNSCINRINKNFALPCGICVALFIFSITNTVLAADYTITINCDEVKPPTKFISGFLHGYGIEQTLDVDLIGNNLAPRCWRLGLDGWKRYPHVAKFNPSITMNVADLYADRFGNIADVKPWMDWPEWEAFCKEQAQYCKDNQLRVDFWDIWSEPDTLAMWKGTWQQLLETYKRGHDTIKAVDPEAKFVGPGTTEFEHPFDCDQSKQITDFVYELSQPPYNVRLDAVSWHELGAMPSTMPQHADSLRKFLADSQYFSQPYLPELHVNEYSAPTTAQIPAWIVGWLYYAEESQINWLSRACWTMWEDSWPFKRAWSNCTEGLDGLLMRDLKTPQQVYYAYLAYAGLNTETRIAAASNNDDVNALAAKNDAEKRVRVLTGLYNKQFINSSVEIMLHNFPYQTSAAEVLLVKVENKNVLNSRYDPKAQPATGPEFVRSETVSVQDGTVSVLITPYKNGDIYLIDIYSPNQ